MSWLQHKGSKGMLGKSAKGVVLLALFLSVLALANSTALHSALHLNATAPDHHCAVTLLASGQVDLSSPASPIIGPVEVLVSFVFADHSFPSGPSFNLPLSRGPPALLS
jgi:hypothetical protein